MIAELRWYQKTVMHPRILQCRNVEEVEWAEVGLYIESLREDDATLKEREKKNAG